jgi:hypothetical protein
MLIFSSRQVWDGNVLVTDNYDQITIKWGQVCSTKKYNGQLGCCFKFITNRPVLGWAAAEFRAVNSWLGIQSWI